MQRTLAASPNGADARDAADRAGDGVHAFFVLACGVTWILALPAAAAWIHHAPPSPLAVACAGLSAFGPTLAALAIAAPRRQLRDTFGRWRTNPLWVVAALFVPAAVHAIATALDVVVGGHPAQWFHPPATAEQVAALVVFPIGEEFGWRGFAHPRMLGRHGPVKGSMLLGAVWGLWHLAYAITPEAAGFDPFAFIQTMIELPLYALLVAWLFERSGRSMAVAIAVHAGAHLDHIERVPHSDWRLHAMHLLVLSVAALLAARALARPASRFDA
jgi:membrane protease YdiL (CAAX protease family)